MTFTPTTPPSFASIPRPAFGRAAQHMPGSPAPLRTKADARHQRAALTAAELLPEIPEPGESIHTLMTGTFDLCQVIAATAGRLTDLRALRIATLCFSKRNVADLAGLLDARRDGPPALTILVSVFFKEHNKPLYEHAAEELAGFPNTRLAAARSHCKVVCFDFGDRDGLVFEGSANLRNNRNREQLTATRDRRLHDWHAGWIDDLTRASNGQQEARG